MIAASMGTALVAASSAHVAPTRAPASGDDACDDADRVAFESALAGAMSGAPPATAPATPEPPARDLPGDGITEDGQAGLEGGVAAEGQSAVDALTACCTAAGALASRGLDAAAAALLAANGAASAPAPVPTTAAGASGSGDPVTRANRDRAALDPALDARLARVEARMRAAGHPLRIAETGRSAARQDWLFAQGRTRPGPVVTWTRASRHETGRAVDVTVGGPEQARGYALLQEVARAEGLVTLGMRDPGHLELREGDGTPAVALAAARRDRPAGDGVGLDAIARLAPEGVIEEVLAPVAPREPRAAGAIAGVARVAQTARVAQVAAVAAVARPGVPPSTAQARDVAAVARGSDDALRARAGAQRLLQLATAEMGAARGAAPAAADTAAHAIDALPGAAGVSRAALDATPAGARPARERLLALMQRALARAGRDDAGADDATAAPNGPRAAATLAVGVGAATGEAGGPGNETSARSLAQVAQVRALRDAPVPVVSSLAVALDRGDGDADRVRVGLAGQRLDASIVSSDRGLAQLLREGIPELATSLERAGLAADRLDVVHRERVARAEVRPASVAMVDPAAASGVVTTARDASSTGFGHPGAPSDPRAGQYQGGGQDRDGRRHPSPDPDADRRPAFASVLSGADESR